MILGPGPLHLDLDLDLWCPVREVQDRTSDSLATYLKRNCVSLTGKSASISSNLNGCSICSPCNYAGFTCGDFFFKKN